MDVLFEFEGSRKAVKVTKESLLHVIETELKSFGYVVRVVLSGGEAEEGWDGCYILQRWSPRWMSYVDVQSVDEVMEEDRLTVIPRPKRGVDPEQPQEKKVCDVFTCTITCAGVQRACSGVLVMMANIIDRCTKVAIL